MLNFSEEINQMTKRALVEYQNSPLKKRANQDRLNATGNIYFIFSDGVLKYIGQRQAKGIRTRLDQHLFGKSYSVDKNQKKRNRKATRNYRFFKLKTSYNERIISINRFE